jgi:hypothetical protein
MRLLEWPEAGVFSLSKTFADEVPPYTILLYTWGEDDKEVTFQDLKDGLRDGASERKPGYKKIRFCGEQARKDGLLYFWVDTCCTMQTHPRRQGPTIKAVCAAEIDDIVTQL